MSRAISPTRVALPALRCVSALCLIEHATVKIFGYPSGVMPQPPLASLMGFAGLLELFGGIAILLGMFTRQVAFILSGEMAVAYFMVHAPNSFFPLINKGESAILFCFIFLYLAAAGPGLWAIDNVRPISDKVPSR